MSAILLPRKFTRQPQQPTLIADGRRPGACFIGSSQAELEGGRSLSESNLRYDVKPIGRVRTVTLGRGFSDSYPVNVPALEDFTVYLYASFVDAADAFQYLLGMPSSAGANLGIPASHASIGGHWGILLGGSAFVDSGEFLPQNQPMGIVVTRSGGVVKIFRDGILKNSALDSTAIPAINALVLNSYAVAGGFGVNTGTYFALAGVDQVAWPDARARAFGSDPWSIFKAPPRKLWFEPPAPVGTSGSVNYTNIDDSSAAAATPTVTASSATTNANDASSASATPVVTASSATTNADDVSNASAAVGSEVTATVAVTNADDTSAATASPVISASSGTTNTDDVSSGTAAATVTGSAANTNADDISAASAAAGSEVAGSVAYTNIDDVSSATAIPAITAQAASINADDSSSATLTATVTASVAVANSNDVSAAYSGAVVEGSIAVTNADDVSAATASPVVSLSSATTNADDVSSAEAVAEAGEIIASVDVTNADDVSGAVAAPLIVGSVAYSNLHDLSAAIAEINFGTIVEAALTSGLVQESRVKKPGIPSDAPEWQRTMFEIFTGRRGNKIDVAKFQSLTFSATPTQAECEALYSYINEVRQSIDQLTKRFDS